MNIWNTYLDENTILCSSITCFNPSLWLTQRWKKSLTNPINVDNFVLVVCNFSLHLTLYSTNRVVRWFCTDDFIQTKLKMREILCQTSWNLRMQSSMVGVRATSHEKRSCGGATENTAQRLASCRPIGRCSAKPGMMTWDLWSFVGPMLERKWRMVELLTEST